MRKKVYYGEDARTCKQSNLRVFNLTLNRVLKELPTYDRVELFTTEWRGYRFNALPFILSGAAYFDNVCYGWLLKFIADEFPVIKDAKLSDLYKDSLICASLFQSLLPGDNGRRELYAMLFQLNPELGTKLLYRCAARVLNRTVIMKDFPHIAYQYKDICNTQAFCFYMSVYWLININSDLRKQIDPNVKRSKFLELFDSLCPEQSIHFRYIKGELTMAELYEEYEKKTFEDGSTISIREAYSNVTKGHYDGSPMDKSQWSIGREEVDDLFQGAENYLNMHLAHAYLYAGTYDNLTRSVDQAKSECIKLQNDVERAKQRYTKAQDESQRLRNKNRELVSQVSQLQAEISRHKTDDKLHKRIKELERDLQHQSDEVSVLFDERLELRQELSRRAKEIKQLKARFAELGVEGEQEGVDSNCSDVEDFIVDIDTMVSALKDKRIVVIGGDRSKSLSQTFKDWGFSHFSNLTGNVRGVDCDFLVICSILCSHTDVRQAEKWVRGKDTELVYVKAVNAELILRELYNTLS